MSEKVDPQKDPQVALRQSVPAAEAEQAGKSGKRAPLERHRDRLPDRSQPFADQVAARLADRRRSVRWLANELGISQSHLSRALRRTDSKKPSVELMTRVAARLDLDLAGIPEYRELKALEAVQRSAELRDLVFNRVSTADGSSSPAV